MVLLVTLVMRDAEGRRWKGSRLPLWILALASCALPASGQCTDWAGGFHVAGNSPIPAGAVSDFAAFDDGGGLDLYAAGSFHYSDGVRTDGIARYDGVQWTPVGGGLVGYGLALAVFDGGSGAALYAGGQFTLAGGSSVSHLARWDGSTWSAVAGPFGEGVGGVGPPFFANAVIDLLVFDDGSGPALYVAGDFLEAGGVPASHIARFDGESWSAVGAGFDQRVNALGVFDDGSGTALHAGGVFQSSGGTLIGYIARWDGAAWQEVGGGVRGEVEAFEVWDDGGGPALYVGGYFDQAGGSVPVNRLARWDGAVWAGIGPATPIDGVVNALEVFDEGLGSGPELFIGRTIGASGVRFQKWNGSSLSTVAGDVQGGLHVFALHGADLAGGDELFVGGSFRTVGSAPPGFASLNAVAWNGTAALAVGVPGLPLDAAVEALLVHDDGSGSALFAGGGFQMAGNVAASRIARFDGSAWSALGAGVDGTVRALAEFDDGSGGSLYAGGDFAQAGGALASRIARWDGASWSPLGSGVTASVHALATWDDGGGEALYAGGEFTTAGGAAASRIARWDGSSWSALGSGLSGRVRSIAAFEGQLYVGGSFASAGGVAAPFIARWDGSQWHPVSPSLDGDVWALRAFDDGTGEGLFAGGDFTFAGGLQVLAVARRRDGVWEKLAGGIVGQVRALVAFDDGTGPALYAGGDFLKNGSRSLVRWNAAVEKWNGGALFGAGLDDDVHALVPWSDGPPTAQGLYAGGAFLQADGRSSEHVGRWGPAFTCPAETYCTAGTTSSGCNALISGLGSASLSLNAGFDVAATGVEGDKQGILFWGTAPQALPWGAGTSWLCVAAPVVRTTVQSSGGTPGTCEGILHLDFNSWMASNSSKAPAAGTAVHMQGWFRDPPSPKSTSLSNAVRFLVAP